MLGVPGAQRPRRAKPGVARAFMLVGTVASSKACLHLHHIPVRGKGGGVVYRGALPIISRKIGQLVRFSTISPSNTVYPCKTPLIGGPASLFMAPGTQGQEKNFISVV